MKWFVQATVHHQESRYSTRQIRIPPFTITNATDECHAKYIAKTIINPTDNPSVTILFSSLSPEVRST